MVVLFLCRWLVPTEGTEQGSTLWIAACWLGLGACRAWWLWRSGQGSTLRAANKTFPTAEISFPRASSLQVLSGVLKWGWADVGVLLLIGGHGLSGVLALTGACDQRATLNLIWEWVSIGGLWLLLKEGFQQSEMRRIFGFCLLVTVIVLSGMGIWQHFVWYPQQSHDLTRLLELQAEQEAGTPLSSSSQQEYERLRSEFGTEFLSLEASGRQMLLARARDSREPIGRFALANTFAAILIWGWFANLDLIRACLSQRVSRSTLCLAGVTIVLISICLLLTKSRTAVMGMLASGLLMGILFAIQPGSQRQAFLKWGGILSACGLGLAVLLTLSGSLDTQILSEAPKSLAYRLEYWQSTWKMIQDHPLLGVGPGNFRQHYFAYKLPGASEEILDPHNLILDVWANGGLPALLGLLLIVGVVVNRLRALAFPTDSPSLPATAFLKTTSWIGLGTFRAANKTSQTREVFIPRASSLYVLLGVLSLILSEEWLFEGFFDDALFWLGMSWLLLDLLLQRVLSFWSISSAAVMAAGIALFVHLLGAGGIGMPAILQLLLVVVLWLTPVGPADHMDEPDNPPGNRQRRLLLPATGVFGILFLGCLWTGLVPVVTVNRLLDRGRSEALVSRRLDLAEKIFQQAAQADTFAWTPHAELAAIHFQRWLLRPDDDAEQFQQAVHEKQQALQRNPLAAKEYLTLSDWWLQRFRRFPHSDSAEAALASAQQGVRLYPGFVRLQMQLAFAWQAVGDPQQAEQAARVALNLDQLNRERGHTDKLLPEDRRQALQDLLSETVKSH